MGSSGMFLLIGILRYSTLCELGLRHVGIQAFVSEEPTG